MMRYDQHLGIIIIGLYYVVYTYCMYRYIYIYTHITYLILKANTDPAIICGSCSHETIGDRIEY